MGCNCKRKKQKRQLNDQQKKTTPFQTCPLCAYKHISFCSVLDEDVDKLGELYLCYRHLCKTFPQVSKSIFDIITDYFKNGVFNQQLITDSAISVHNIAMQSINNNVQSFQVLQNVQQLQMMLPQMQRAVLLLSAADRMHNHQVGYFDVNRQYVIELLNKVKQCNLQFEHIDRINYFIYRLGDQKDRLVSTNIDQLLKQIYQSSNSNNIFNNLNQGYDLLIKAKDFDSYNQKIGCVFQSYMKLRYGYVQLANSVMEIITTFLSTLKFNQQMFNNVVNTVQLAISDNIQPTEQISYSFNNLNQLQKAFLYLISSYLSYNKETGYSDIKNSVSIGLLQLAANCRISQNFKQQIRLLWKSIQNGQQNVAILSAAIIFKHRGYTQRRNSQSSGQ